MSIDANELHSLPDAEKMRIVEMLWDDLGQSTTPIPLPDWVQREASRRRDDVRSRVRRNARGDLASYRNS